MNIKQKLVFLLVGLLFLSLNIVASAAPIQFIKDTHVQNVGISGSPAEVSYNGKLYVFHPGGPANELWFYTYDGINTTPDQQVPITDLAGNPALVVYNGILYCFHNTNGGGLYYITFDGTNWGPDTHVQNVGISGSPAVVNYNSELYIFHPGGPANELWYFTFDGTSTTPDQQVPFIGLAGNPAPVVYNGDLYCFHNTIGVGLCYITFDGTNWGPDTHVQNVGISGSPAAINYEGMLHVFHPGGPSNELWCYTFDGINPSQDKQILVSDLAGNPAPVIYNGDLYCFHNTNGNGLYYTVLGNGHYYDVISVPGITWVDAKAAAEQKTLDVSGVLYKGHLATITSQDENDFIVNNLDGFSCWLGGYQPDDTPDSMEPNGNWHWVTNETWDYTNWYLNRPDNAGSGENWLAIWGENKWDDGNVDVLGSVRGYVVEYEETPKPSETYTFVTKWGSNGSEDGQFTDQRGIAIDSLGNVYVTDWSRIQKFDSNGNFITKWGSRGSGDGQFNYPWGVAVDSSGNFYVADKNNNRIQKFDDNGNFVTKWGSYGSSDGQFSDPKGIAVDSSGNVYVVDSGNNRIQKFDSNGTFITKWGSSDSGDGQLYSPQAIAIDSSGNVYVTDLGINRIKKFDSNGIFITTWGFSASAGGQFSALDGIAVDSLGDVYVADWSFNHIQKFNSNGTFITKWGSSGSGDGQFNASYGVAVDSSGNVYVTDLLNYRIQKFAPIKTHNSAPIYNSENGHYYEVKNVPGSITWEDANNAAQSSSYLGMNGHLATITSQNENEFIVNNFNMHLNYNWLGGFQPDGSAEPNGGWQWITEEPWNYTNWNSGEPNDIGDIGEDRLHIYANGFWNDASDASTIQNGYIVEYEEQILPVANFSTNVTIGNIPLSVQFTDLSENALGWNWNFGDGSTSAEQNPKHTYSAAGNYTVTLTVNNSYGSNVMEQNNLIIAKNPDKPIIGGKVPFTVRFKDKSENAIGWNWDFGDGSTSTEQSPTHTYTKVGQYTVTLTVSNPAGNNVVTKGSYISVVYSLEAPVATFSASTTYGKEPLNVSFTDMSTGSPASWYWDFGDGSNSIDQNPVHIYSNPGQYNVVLTASNEAGSTTLAKYNYITVGNSLSTPVAEFSASAEI